MTAQRLEKHAFNGASLSTLSLVEKLRHCRAPIVFHYNALGDHLLLRPTVLALQKIYGNRLGFVGAKRMVDTFYADASLRFSHAMCFRQDGGDSEVSESFAFNQDDVLAVRDKFDSVINLNWWDSPQIGALSRVLDDIPFLTLAAPYGHIPPIRVNQHVCDYMFQVPMLLDKTLKVEDFVSLPSFADSKIRSASYVRQRMPADAKILAVQTITRPGKQWGTEKFKQLLHEFLNKNPDYVVLILDREYTGLDEGPFHSRIFCVDEFDLLTSTALLSQCDLFVGIDSYFLHAADFAHIPAVGLFGPTSPAQWGLRFTRHRHVVGPATADIEVDEVLDALQSLAVPETACP